MYSMTMTDLKNTNDPEDRSRNIPLEDTSPVKSPTGDSDWEAFVQSHAQDLQDVEHSRAARKFERQAKRSEKEPLVSVDDLKRRAFVAGNRHAVPGGGMHDVGRSAGPRDHTTSSWLDTDDVMDQGDEFTPPNPELGKPNTTRLVLWLLFLAGIFGIMLSVFVHVISGLLTAIFGCCFLLGAAGIVMMHKGHDDTKSGPQDDGARV